MRGHRLSRLSQLTQGAALVGLGLGLADVACSSPQHVNSPHPSTTDSAGTAPSAMPDEPRHVNAPAEPTAEPIKKEETSAPPTASATAPAASNAPPVPKHVNSPPK